MTLDTRRFTTLQAGLLLFWAVWLSLVALTNLTDALRKLGVLPESLKWASYNYDLVAQTVGAHGVPASIAAVLFGGVIAWELLAAGLFWRAFDHVRRGGATIDGAVTQAFVVSLALWAAFLIATEAFVNYVTAATHKGTLIAQLVTLLVMRSGAGALQAEPSGARAVPDGSRSREFPA